MSDSQRLKELIQGNRPCISCVTYEESYVRDIVINCAVALKKDLFIWTVTEGLRNGIIADDGIVPNTDHPAAAMLHLAHQHGPRIVLALDLAGHLDDQRTLRVMRDLLYRFERIGSTLVMVDHLSDLPKPIENYTTHFYVSLPDEDELETIVLNTLRTLNKKSPIEMGVTRGQLKVIIRNLLGLTRRQAEQIIIDCIADNHKFNQDNINSVMALKRQLLQGDGLLEYIESPTSLDAIGGLGKLKAWLQFRQNTLDKDAREYGLDSPRGVLMLGVQGAGKSLCAKAIATAWQRPLLRMDTGALYDRYIGESEKRLRESLKQAEMMSPNVLWIDEIEKAFASAASRNSDGGLSQRMFGTLLTWMQEHTKPVFLVATANDIEALPPELLRKGRFDEIFFVDLPILETRKEIFAIHLNKRKRDAKTFDIDQMAMAAEGFSGAEIEQAIVSAMHVAFHNDMLLVTTHIMDVIKTSPPLSVTMKEKVVALQDWAKDRCMLAE